MNVGMVVLHWLFSPGVYLWIENAPIPQAAAKPAVEEKKTTSDADVADEKTSKNVVTDAEPKKRTVAEPGQDDFSWAM